jgi:hypothetical protein
MARCKHADVHCRESSPGAGYDAAGRRAVAVHRERVDRAARLASAGLLSRQRAPASSPMRWRAILPATMCPRHTDARASGTRPGRDPAPSRHAGRDACDRAIVTTIGRATTRPRAGALATTSATRLRTMVEKYPETRGVVTEKRQARISTPAGGIGLALMSPEKREQTHEKAKEVAAQVAESHARVRRADAAIAAAASTAAARAKVVSVALSGSQYFARSTRARERRARHAGNRNRTRGPSGDDAECDAERRRRRARRIGWVHTYQ